MKTTVEIPDALLAEARRIAQRDATTLRGLVEEGLRRVLGERAEQSGFRLRKVSFGGQGLTDDLSGSSWEEIRRRAYEGRGG